MTTKLTLYNLDKPRLCDLQRESQKLTNENFFDPENPVFGSRNTKIENWKIFLTPTTLYRGFQQRKNEKHVVFLLKTLFLSSQHKSKKLEKNVFLTPTMSPLRGGLLNS